MAKDILLNIDIGDIQLNEKLDEDAICYDSFWSESNSVLFLNIIIPSKNQNLLKYDDSGFFECTFKASYCPDTRYFRIKFLIDNNGTYGELDQSITPIPSVLSAKVYKNGSYELTDISACQLPIININGEFKLLVRNTDNITAELYSAISTDINFGISSDQSAKLLSICAPGKNYRYPLAGVSITDYINSVIVNSDLAEKLMREFENNNTTIASAEFDPETGNLNVKQSSDLEENVSGTMDNLGLDIILNASDDYIRDNLKDIEETLPDDVMREFSELEDIYGIFFIGDAKIQQIKEKLIPNKTFSFYHESDNKSYFKGYDAPNYMVSSAILYPGDVIFLKNLTWSALAMNTEIGETFNVNTPFVITDFEEDFDGTLIKDNSLFSKIKVHSYDTSYDECAIINKKCRLFYTLRAQDIISGSGGVFRITFDSVSIKDIVCLVHDKITGRLIAHIANNSNITGISFDQQRSRLLIQKQR